MCSNDEDIPSNLFPRTSSKGTKRPRSGPAIYQSHWFRINSIIPSFQRQDHRINKTYRIVCYYPRDARSHEEFEGDNKKSINTAEIPYIILSIFTLISCVLSTFRETQKEPGNPVILSRLKSQMMMLSGRFCTASLRRNNICSATDRLPVLPSSHPEHL